MAELVLGKGMKIGGIYYTTNRLDPKIWNICLNQLKESFKGDVVSVSLKPLDFGRNIVLEGLNPSYPTYLTQICTALENSDADAVFFLEHDVLYHPSHFDFVPERDDIFYYNVNNYRWRYETDIAITYDELHSLSSMCCNRELALRHYQYRIEVMNKEGLDKDRSREPRWARRFGYEPGTKKIRKGGITDEDFEVWRSDYPNVDIRHQGTFSHPKTFRREFKHIPPTFREVKIDEIPGWDLRSLFEL